MMRTIQMTLDDDLVHELDSIVKESNTNRSAFTRDALRKAIIYYHQLSLAEKHRKGYQKNPVQDGEFSDWLSFTEVETADDDDFLLERPDVVADEGRFECQ